MDSYSAVGLTERLHAGRWALWESNGVSLGQSICCPKDVSKSFDQDLLKLPDAWVASFFDHTKQSCRSDTNIS